MSYCRKCGVSLVESRRLNHYDETDGHAMYQYIRTCPNRKSFPPNGHTKVGVIAASDAVADDADAFYWRDA